MLVGSDLLSWLSGRELLPPFMTKVYESARDPGVIALVLVAVAVAAPLGEEIKFCGFLFWRLGGLAPRRGRHDRAHLGHLGGNPHAIRLVRDGADSSASACCSAGCAGAADRPRSPC